MANAKKSDNSKKSTTKPNVKNSTKPSTKKTRPIRTVNMMILLIIDFLLSFSLLPRFSRNCFDPVLRL